jgi:hypothetical protein
LILAFVDDFVELNFSDRNFLNLRPYPDTNLAFHGVSPEALTIPLKTAKNPLSTPEWLVLNCPYVAGFLPDDRKRARTTSAKGAKPGGSLIPSP